MELFMKKKIYFRILISLLVIIIIIASVVGVRIAVEGNKPQAKILTTSVEDKKSVNHDSYMLEINESTKSPKDNNVKDVVAYTLWKTSNCKKFKVSTEGKTTASMLFKVEQKIKNERIINDNNALITTTSTGVITLANQRFVMKDKNKCLYRETQKVNDLVPEFDDSEPTTILFNEYLDKYGWLPFQNFGYIINNETYLQEPTLKDNLDNTYTISIDLNPNEEYAPFYYRHEILTSSGSTTVPIFKKIHLDLTIDSTYTTLSVDMEEVYTVTKLGFGVDTMTKLRDTYSYDDDAVFDSKYSTYFNKYSN
jgi:hypothetical protein